MMTWNLNLVSLLVGILLLATSAYLVYQCFFSPLASFPGPLLAKFTSAYFAYLSYRGKCHHDLQDLHGKYGSVVRISPNALLVFLLLQDGAADPRDVVEASPILSRFEKYTVSHVRPSSKHHKLTLPRGRREIPQV